MPVGGVGLVCKYHGVWLRLMLWLPLWLTRRAGVGKGY